MSKETVKKSYTSKEKLSGKKDDSIERVKGEVDYTKINEEIAIEALKTGNAKIAYQLNIFPIEIMQRNKIYKKRFNNNVYDELLLKSELAVLYAKDGGNQWLIGERLSYIRDHRIYKKYGWTSFKEFIREDLPYAVSTVYNYIDIFKRFSYEESIKAGSKLSLFTQAMESLGEEDRQSIINKFANDSVSYRDAKRLSLKFNKNNPLSEKEINDDVFFDVTDEGDEELDLIDTPVQSDENKISNYQFKPVKMSIFRTEFKKGELSLSDDQVKLIKKNKIKYQLILGFHDEFERRAINDILNNDVQIIKSLSKKVERKLQEYKSQEKIIINDAE